jgi:hypothetical protein
MLKKGTSLHYLTISEILYCDNVGTVTSGSKINIISLGEILVILSIVNLSISGASMLI